jgi:hypothetical protein
MDTPVSWTDLGFGRTDKAGRFMPDLKPGYNLIRSPHGEEALLRRLEPQSRPILRDAAITPLLQR